MLCTSELGLTKRVQLETGEAVPVPVTKSVIRARVILESFQEAQD